MELRWKKGGAISPKIGWREKGRREGGLGEGHRRAGGRQGGRKGEREEVRGEGKERRRGEGERRMRRGRLRPSGEPKPMSGVNLAEALNNLHLGHLSC